MRLKLRNKIWAAVIPTYEIQSTILAVFYKLSMVLCQSSYISCGSSSGSFVAQLSVAYAGDSVKYNDSNLYKPGTVISIIWRLLISQISIKIYYSNRATLDLKADNQVMACKMTFLN